MRNTEKPRTQKILRDRAPMRFRRVVVLVSVDEMFLIALSTRSVAYFQLVGVHSNYCPRTYDTSYDTFIL